MDFIDADNKYRILQIHNLYQIPGGEDTVVANEKRLLEEHGHTVIQYTRSNNELKEFTKFRKLLLPFITIFNLRTYREVKRIIRQENIDIVHVHNTLCLISPAVYYAALRCKVPVVQTMHNFRLLCPGATFYRDGHICEDCVESGLWRAVRYGCYRGSKVQTFACVVNMWLHRLTGIYGKINYICLTEFNKEKLLMLRQIKPDKVFVKPNFTFADVPFGDRGGYRRGYLFIGRIEEMKGIKLLLDAFYRMPEQKLMIAGTGAKIGEYRERASGNIQFLGFLQRPELYQVLRTVQAVIVPSQCYETFGMVIIEAFAGGVPVIAGDIGNIGQLVEEGVTGKKFQYDSTEALVKVVREFDAEDTERMGRAAYETFKSSYSEEVNYRIMMRIYALLDKGGRSRQGK